VIIFLRKSRKIVKYEAKKIIHRINCTKRSRWYDSNPTAYVRKEVVALLVFCAALFGSYQRFDTAYVSHLLGLRSARINDALGKRSIHIMYILQCNILAYM
jgi:hypothetical protein